MAMSGRFVQLMKLAKVSQIAVRTYAEPASGLRMMLTFGSPAQNFYNNVDVKQIDVPSFSGSFGILPSHVPTLAVLKPGVVTVIELDGKHKKFFVSSGSVSVNGDSTVQILAEEACDIRDLDAAAAKEGLANAQRQLASAGADEVKKAEAEISIEAYDALVKAAAES